MAQTAPEGYGSNYAALLDLIRFGFALWTPSQMAVLLFHAERSTALGRESDQHSEAQAMTGIFSQRQLEWVRGPAGISSTTWHRINGELAFDPKKTEAQNEDKVLHRTRRQNRFGKDDPTEFSINWPAVKGRIAKWKEEVRESQTGTLSLPAQDSQSPKLGPSRNGRANTPASESPKLGPTDSDFKSSQTVGHSPGAREAPHPSAAAIATAIEQASGERPRTDRLINTILEIGERLQLPETVLVRWIHDKCQDLRSKGALTSAGILGHPNCISQIIPWMKKPENRNFIEAAQRRSALEAQRSADIKAMPQLKEDIAAAIEATKARRA